MRQSQSFLCMTGLPRLLFLAFFHKQYHLALMPFLVKICCKSDFFPSASMLFLLYNEQIQNIQPFVIKILLLLLLCFIQSQKRCFCCCSTVLLPKKPHSGPKIDWWGLPINLNCSRAMLWRTWGGRGGWGCGQGSPHPIPKIAPVQRKIVGRAINQATSDRES